ncbi:MAG TPA: peptide chain release factor-like protein [Candidatus Omnitrophota bacterium]|nr:peptide chain release factor-like protein [Candidatus Omnitrophota bacterium]
MTPQHFFSDKENALCQKMLRLKILEKDIQESFIRSSGPGGQNVNKVSTCVVLLHRPTKIQVRSQRERSQALNRYHARCLLVAKIEERRRKEREDAIFEREKKRRQERQCPKTIREKILELKKKRSRRKQERQRIRPHKLNDLM